LSYTSAVVFSAAGSAYSGPPTLPASCSLPRVSTLMVEPTNWSRSSAILRVAYSVRALSSIWKMSGALLPAARVASLS
jgi:hypothetical protein